VGPGGVVVRHPGVQGGLGLLDGVEQLPVEELAAHRLVQPFDLAGGGGRVRRRQQVADAVVVADPVKQHRPRPGAEPVGLRPGVEAVNTLPLSVRIACGTPWRANAAPRASQTGRAVARSSSLASTQNRDVIDPSHRRQLAAVGQPDPPDDVQLPQLHRSGAFPALGVLATPAPLLGLDQPMAHQRPVQTGAPRQRHDPLTAKLGQDAARPPTRMRPPQRHHPRLDRGGIWWGQVAGLEL
jgi:hypothetical protein